MKQASHHTFAFEVFRRLKLLTVYILTIFVMLPFVFESVSGQPNQQLLTKTLTVEAGAERFFLDTWVIPASITLETAGRKVESEDNWSYDAETGDIIIQNNNWLRSDSATEILVRYRRLPVGLRLNYYERMLRPADELIAEDDTTTVLPEGVLIGRRTEGRDLFGSSRLQRSGSISRGITVGTNQDASLESGLRFELSGQITDDIEVVASLTDQNTPIQPDGSTQNLREFDQVYIRLMHERGMLQLGDVDVSLRSSEFAQIERRLQGIDVQADLGSAGAYQASASVVRGRFRSMNFSGRNGVQGPYRLTGSQGETFIIVLAGTERVYLNGQQLTRGEENDYIIDYALGEVTFTNRRMISDNSRITVDFQYVTEEYNRTLLTAEADHDELMGGRLSVGATVIQESDSRELASEFGLTDEERRILREAGADVDQAVISGADSVGFRRNADFILYARADTTFQGQTFTIFRAAPDDSSAVWRVRFSRVDAGGGSYRRAESTINGIVYEWVGPGQGSYEPFRTIPAPQQQRMLAVRSRYALSRHLEIFGESAFNEVDVNRFSNDSETRSQGMAYLAGMQLKPVETRIGEMSAVIRRRHTQRDFRYFDRTRDVEFDRIWNLRPSPDNQETLTDAEVNLALSDFSVMRTGGGHLERADLESTRGFIRINTNEPGAIGWNQDADYVRTSYFTDNRESEWLRQRGRVDYSFSLAGVQLTPGLDSEAEVRTQRLSGADSLDPTSFRFAELIPGIRAGLTEQIELSVAAGWRADDTVRNGRYVSESETRTAEIRTSYRGHERLQISAGGIYREKTFRPGFEAEGDAALSRSLLFQTTADYTAPSDWLQMQWQYEGGTESKPLLQETFIEVGPELGNYVWIDLNNDGVQQLNEFFPAQTPGEGTFIRQFVPSDELIPVVSVNSRLRTRIHPGEILEGEFWEQLAVQTVLEVREQNEGGSIADIMLLRLNRFLDDEFTLSGRLFWQQEVQFFRNNRDADLRLRYDRLTSKNRRSAGLEEQRNRNGTIDMSYRFTRRIQAGTELSYSERNFLSERLAGRSFEIRGLEAEPFIRYTASRSLQSTAGFAIGRKRDFFPAETVELRRYRIFSDVRWFYQNILQTSARLEFRSNRSDGISSSFGTFELTDGAGIGETWQWSLQATWRISTYLRATLNYDGRSVQQGSPIQTLRFTMNAVF